MKKKILISVDERVAEKLKELAETSCRSVSQWVTDKVLESAKSRENIILPENNK